jgi:hypothetical protein
MPREVHHAGSGYQKYYNSRHFALKYFSLSHFNWELEPPGLWLKDLVFEIRAGGFQ